MFRYYLFFLIGLVPCLVSAAPPVVQSAVPAPDVDALFQQTEGWIGADGAYSIAVSPRRKLWLFSDTWIGKIRDGRRTDATIVNNSIGVQTGNTAHLTYSFARGADGKPAALIRPADGRGWFWLQAGQADQGRLVLFLNQVEKTDGTGVFDFRSVGVWLGTVDNSDEPPEAWQVKQTKMPNTVFSNEHAVAWGAAVLRVDDDLYVYGTDDRRTGQLLNRQMIVARVPLKSVSDFSAWRYFKDGDWIADFREASPIAGDMASEYSVTPFEKGYISVYTDRGLSPRIMARTADHPWGPWSTSIVIYECPEMSRDKNLFCYAAKVHPSLSSNHELIVSYVVNSFDFWQVARQAELYWPRFVRVTFKSEP